MPIGLGIVGCGWAAGEIARASLRLPEMRIVSAFDRDPSRAQAFAGKAGARLASSFEALLADTEVTTVYVGLPHHLLAEAVGRALNAGKHVLAEKPLALDPEEAKRLGKLADGKGLKLCVFFELRRAGTVTAAKRIIEDGDIGTPQLIRLRTLIDKRSDYWGPPGAPNWRARRADAGGGVLLMNTIHQLDTLRYITGLDYVAASGTIATFAAAAEVEDAGSAWLRLSNGGIVSIATSAHSPGANHDETIEIDGSSGRLDLPDPFGIAPLRVYRSETKVWNEIAIERPDSHLLMLRGFAEAIARDLPVPADASDAASALGAVLAIYRSSIEGRTIHIG